MKGGSVLWLEGTEDMTALYRGNSSILKMDIKQVFKDGESQKIYTRQLVKCSQGLTKSDKL